MTKFRYIGLTRPVKVYEHRSVISGSKDENDKAVMMEQSDGWFVRIGEHFSIGVGNSKPPLQDGDVLVLTLQKMGPKMAQSFKRPANYGALSRTEQAAIDKELGLTYWDGNPYK